MGNGEAKELICMTHGHELSQGERQEMLKSGGIQGKGGEKNGTTVIT